MKQEDIEKAWAIMSMHNSELLLRVVDLEKQLDHQQSIWAILKRRVTNLFRSKA
jgi:hypothetical protein